MPVILLVLSLRISPLQGISRCCFHSIMWCVAQIQGALSKRTKKPEQTYGISLFRDLWVSWLALRFFISVNQETSLHLWKMKRYRLGTILDACELIQEAQLLNEHYDLNTRADSINRPSVGVHTQLVQIYPSQGGNSIIIRDLASLPKAPWGGPSKIKGQLPRELLSTGHHGQY